MVNAFQLLNIFSESSILDVCQSSEYASYFNGQYILVYEACISDLFSYLLYSNENNLIYFLR